MNFFNTLKNKRNTRKFEDAVDRTVHELKEEVKLFVTAIEQVEQKYGKSEEAKIKATSIQFILLSLSDIFVLIKYLQKPTATANDKNLFARTLALHFYEFFQDTGKILGKEIEDQLLQLKSQEADNEFQWVKTTFKIIRKQYVDIVKPLRMKVAAHKDRDISIQFSLIESVDIDKMETLGLQFYFFALLFVSFKKTFQSKMIEFVKKSKVS